MSEGFREKLIGFSEKNGRKSELYPCFTLLLGENILVPFPRIIYPFSIHYIFYLKKIQRNKRMDGKLGLIDHTPCTLVKHIYLMHLHSWLIIILISLLFFSQILADLVQYDVIYLLDHSIFPGRIQSNYPET